MNDMTAWGHILLAEDNPVNQRVTRAMLENLGFHVDVVDDGVAAVEAAARTPYRAVLMDCQLPRLDGYLAASEIRRWQGASRDAPIIAITASTTTSDEQRCLAAGMDGYIGKPLTLQSLTEVLARWAPDGAAPTSGTAPDAARPVSGIDPRPALDDAIVERLEQLGHSVGEDLLGQLVVLFEADSGDRIAEMRGALAAHDAPAVFRSAHALSGASGNLGATELSRLCNILAMDAETGVLTLGDGVLAAIEVELARVRTALDSRSLTS